MRFAGVVGTWLGWWGALFVIYLLLAAKLTASEVVVGAAAAALAATGTTVTMSAGHLHFRARPGWLRLLGRLGWRVVADLGIVAIALWRQIVQGQPVKGVFRVVPFDGGGPDAVSAARRALVTAGASLAPNAYVVDMDHERGVILFHQLVPSLEPPGGGDREWPL